MKKLLIVSVVINLSLVIFAGLIIHKNGGLGYLKGKFSREYKELHSDTLSYYKTKESIFEIMPRDSGDIVFAGNSITDFCDWYELFGNKNIKNRGIGGDVINGVVKRVDEIVRSNPKKIFLMIGTNDLGEKNTVARILENYEKLIRLVKEKSPRTKLYIQSILPTYHIPDRKNSDIQEINRGLSALAQKYGYSYIDLFNLLKTASDELDTAYTFDGLHLNGKGYLVWKLAIEQDINN
jgi:lysophospholipase L1-like esterase